MTSVNAPIVFFLHRARAPPPVTTALRHFDELPLLGKHNGLHCQRRRAKYNMFTSRSVCPPKDPTVHNIIQLNDFYVKNFSWIFIFDRDFLHNLLENIHFLYF